MYSEIYYLVRSKIDGKYVVAKATNNPDQVPKEFLLLFKEDFTALTYIRTHAPDLIDKFGVESLAGSQLKTLLERWGFQGLAMVKDPLIPTIEFLTLR
jgi:hypothetical protein